MLRKVLSYGYLIIALNFIFSSSLIMTGCSTRSGDKFMESNKRLVHQMNEEVWNKANLAIIEQLFSPNFVLHFLPDGSELKGIDNLRENVRKHREAFPDWGEEIKRIVAEGDIVVIHFVSTGTNEGNWNGKPPTGKKIQINEMSIFRIEDGKIAEQWLLPDIFSMQQQLALTENE